MTHKRRALYSGTFDPLTNGHKYVVDTALKVFDEVTILIAMHPSKKALFTVDERYQMLSEVFKSQSRVTVEKCDGLVVEYANNNDISALVRGLRPTGDFEGEYQMASMNKSLYPEIETVFFMTPGELNFISSSLVKEIAGHGGDISRFVPETIFNKIKNKI